MGGALYVDNGNLVMKIYKLRHKVTSYESGAAGNNDTTVRYFSHTYQGLTPDFHMVLRSSYSL